MTDGPSFSPPPVGDGVTGDAAIAAPSPEVDLPAGPPQPVGVAEVVVPTRRDPRDIPVGLWVAAGLGAIAVDVALRTPPWNNIAGTIGVVLLVVGLLASGRFRSVESRVTLGLAVVLSFFLWLRTNPALITFDVLAVLGLIWVAAVNNRAAALWDTTPLRLLIRAAETIAVAVESVFDIPAEAVARRRRLGDAGGRSGQIVAGVARGALIAAPVLLALGLLLASADAVFASFFTVEGGVDVGPAFGHLVLLAIGAYAAVVLVRLAGRNLGNGPEGELGAPRLGLIEAMMVLVGLNALFAAFGVAQLVALSDGADEVLADAGLTVKEYAREGFFQLLWVAALTAMVLIVMDVLSRHHGPKGRRMVRIASMVAIGLTFVIVVVAYRRLQLYIVDDGHTPLRFYSLVFSFWIAAVFVILGARILGVRADRNWFSAAVGLSAIVFLLGLNMVNPEAVIARTNLERDDRQLLWHLDQFTADGYLVIAHELDRLPADDVEVVREELCRLIDRDYEASFEDRDRPLLRFNRARHNLDTAWDDVCVRS